MQVTHLGAAEMGRSVATDASWKCVSSCMVRASELIRDYQDKAYLRLSQPPLIGAPEGGGEGWLMSIRPSATFRHAIRTRAAIISCVVVGNLLVPFRLANRDNDAPFGFGGK